MYVSRRSSPALVVRSPTRQCVIASARWVSEMILATAWVWETIAVKRNWVWCAACRVLPTISIGQGAQIGKAWACVGVSTQQSKFAGAHDFRLRRKNSVRTCEGMYLLDVDDNLSKAMR